MDGQSRIQRVTYLTLITYNILKEFLWRHMKRHGINYLEKHESSFIRFKLIKALLMLMDSKSCIYFEIKAHLSSTVLGVIMFCVVFIIVFILWVLLTRRRLCDQQRENGLQNGV